MNKVFEILTKFLRENYNLGEDKGNQNANTRHNRQS